MVSKVKAFALAAAALVGLQTTPAQAARCVDDGHAAELQSCQQALRADIEHRNGAPLRMLFVSLAGLAGMVVAAAAIGKGNGSGRTPAPAPVRNPKNNP